MGDLSFRAVEILKSDLILCEDTRVSKKFSKFEINKKVISNHKFNENRNVESNRNFKSKKIVSLVSDAGTPAISDPGKILVNECVKNGIDIFPVPGASAVSAAISISGFSDNFISVDFFPKKKNKLKYCLKIYHHLKVLLYFISPNKFSKRIEDIKEFF